MHCWLTLIFPTHSYIFLVLILDIGVRGGMASPSSFIFFLGVQFSQEGHLKAYVCSFLLQFWFYFVCCKKLFLFTNSCNVMLLDQEVK